MNSIFYRNENGDERVVYAMKDPKWVFYESGDLLWFEDKQNYEQRMIKKRMNRDIIVSYLNKMGIDIKDNQFGQSEGNSYIVEQLHW